MIVTDGTTLYVSCRYALLAACMMHEEGYYSTKSLAFRNNNPGNLEVPDSGGQFQHYGTKLQGYEALVKDIQANAGTTLRAFIAKYAPPDENNTSLYLQVVSVLSQIGEDELL